MRFYGLAGLVTALLFVSPSHAATFRVCHGYECYYRTKVTLSNRDQQQIRRKLIQASHSPSAEREALRWAIALFEQRSTKIIGVRDKPKTQFGRARIKGQMDCIDEATNTDEFLRFLHAKGWLKFHTPARKDSRGSFFDGRYPHWTATVKAHDGQLWAVDSWYQAGGNPPDIMPLSEWKRRGYRHRP